MEVTHDCERLLEDFECRWESSRSGPVGILDFLRLYEPETTADFSFVVDLVEIDIERSWMTWSKELAASVDREPAESLLNRMRNIPKMPDYQRGFANRITLAASQWLRIAQCELEARNEWGDAIGVPHYQYYFRLKPNEDRHFVPRGIQLHGNTGDSRTHQRFPLRGLTVVGRQRRASADPFSCEPFADGNRISIADKDQRHISREQMSIQLLHPAYAIVKNLSRVNTITVQPKSPIRPGESVVIRFPHVLSVSDRRLMLS